MECVDCCWSGLFDVVLFVGVFLGCVVVGVGVIYNVILGCC